jgi:hypothetical protein
LNQTKQLSEKIGKEEPVHKDQRPDGDSVRRDFSLPFSRYIVVKNSVPGHLLLEFLLHDSKDTESGHDDHEDDKEVDCCQFVEHLHCPLLVYYLATLMPRSDRIYNRLESKKKNGRKILEGSQKTARNVIFLQRKIPRENGTVKCG